MCLQQLSRGGEHSRPGIHMGPRILMSIMVSGFQIAVGNRSCGRTPCIREGLRGCMALQMPLGC